MDTPIATYRVQLNKHFNFQDLKAAIPYLSNLGVSHVYASPIFQAKKGSLHGYDVVNPNTINPELGGKAAFEDLIAEVKANGLGWLQDIVPNHASYSPQNKRINDVLANGTKSAYAEFFDVNWKYPSRKLQGKLFAPFLAERYSESIKSKKIFLIHEGGFKVKFGELEFPVSATIQQQLKSCGSTQEALDRYNSDPELLDSLLAKQHYQLGYWRAAYKHINYRRFFDILDLIGIRMENPVAFEEMHRLIFELTQLGMFSGLRVDHIDGLYEPEQYLRMLRARCPDTYVVVEKILTGEEQLAGQWPVEGTTGYDFLNSVNKLFINNSNEPQMNAVYREFTGLKQAYSELLFEAKKTAIENYFLADMVNLARMFNDTLGNLEYAAQYNGEKLVFAVIELMACFPVYRTYNDEKYGDAKTWWAALWLAQQLHPDLAAEFLAVSHLLEASKTSPKALHAIKRFQQFSGAVMAKGLEDTLLYRYNRLISFNDVGSSPAQFGISTEQFHQFNVTRQQKSPLTLNATSTHDTKRGEDVRARLNVLSELTAEFQANIVQWAKINSPKKWQVTGISAPDANEEYYLYQTLLGAFPFNLAETPNFSERVKQHMVKALREAKVHSSWIRQNHPYHRAIEAFVDAVLTDSVFMDAFLPFQKKIACLGFCNSLSQILLKITCPGVPDFYQGTELWDLNLVDPDNRRLVDFELRKKQLADIVRMKAEKASELLEGCRDGKAKLYIIYKTLQLRHKVRLLFEQGAYLPLAVKGSCSRHAVAFCRAQGNAYVLTVVPRFLANLLYIEGGRSAESNSAVKSQKLKGAVDWADTYLSMPQGAPTRWIDIFTDKTIIGCCGRLPLRDVLDTFPVALLVGDSDA